MKYFGFLNTFLTLSTDRFVERCFFVFVFFINVPFWDPFLSKKKVSQSCRTSSFGTPSPLPFFIKSAGAPCGPLFEGFSRCQPQNLQEVHTLNNLNPLSKNRSVDFLFFSIKLLWNVFFFLFGGESLKYFCLSAPFVFVFVFASYTPHSFLIWGTVYSSEQKWWFSRNFYMCGGGGGGACTILQSSGSLFVFGFTLFAV